jgi:uncharacterized protein
MARGAANGPSMKSPCVNVCTLDEATAVCLGCGRTLAEIAAWASLTDAERELIMRRLAQTKKKETERIGS